jgi:His/Glu/Gln/Arg/opine family amino acid ABC transporter permease subunit
MNFLTLLSLQSFADEMSASFTKTFITDDRWLQLLKGLGVTIEISFFAVILGIILGFAIATVRSSYDKLIGKRKCRSFGEHILKFFNGICNIYITIIRGTPMVVQLMIMYYIIFSSSRNGIVAAILSFGINSGAYVSEIVRSGIMSIDPGQLEAGRSLGFNYSKTMIYIIFPQAFKNVLPALGNEFIVLLKETSVAGYVALKDLTYVGNLIRSRTYEAFFPLITVAVIYLVIVMFLSYGLKRLERRLRTSER